jgi:hypothetical protein
MRQFERKRSLTGIVIDFKKQAIDPEKLSYGYYVK